MVAVDLTVKSPTIFIGVIFFPPDLTVGSPFISVPRITRFVKGQIVVPPIIVRPSPVPILGQDKPIKIIGQPTHPQVIGQSTKNVVTSMWSSPSKIVAITDIEWRPE